MTANADQIAYWNEVAGAKWVARQAHLDRLMAPLSEALLAGAAPAEGERALDIGCGCGDLALRLAEAVGPTGQIDAVDVSRPMLSHAEARSQLPSATPRAPIQWHLADAMVHPFAPVAALLASRFGVMFFDDRPRAFRNLHGALAPGGRFAFLTWRRRSDCEWMQAPVDWIAPALAVADDVPGEIGPFALADVDATVALLRDAGFRDVTADRVDRMVTVGTTPDEACELLAEAGPAARALRDADPGPREGALRRLRENVASRAGVGGLVLGAACWLYRGRA